MAILLLRVNPKPYGNARDWWTRNVLKNAPISQASSAARRDAFNKWLLEQGAKLIIGGRPEGHFHLYIVDAFDVDQKHDYLEFENKADLTLFLLRWAA